MRYSVRFDLFDARGDLTSVTFVNLIEAPDGGVVVLARFGHAHAMVTAPLPPARRRDANREHPGGEDPAAA